MMRIKDLSTRKPLYLKYIEDRLGFPVETTVLAIDRLEGTAIVVDWESGRPARISGMDDTFQRSTPLTYEVLRLHDNTVSKKRMVWVTM